MILGADLTRLNGVGPGRVDGWLPAIISFVFLIVACSSPPFLFSPLPFVCLTLLLSIWPTIDKTQSLTMLGALHRIGGDGARALWRVCICSGFRKEMGMRLTSLFIYLSSSRWRSAERMCFLTLSLSLLLSLPVFPHSFPFTASLLWLFLV